MEGPSHRPGFQFIQPYEFWAAVRSRPRDQRPLGQFRANHDFPPGSADRARCAVQVLSFSNPGGKSGKRSEKMEIRGFVLAILLLAFAGHASATSGLTSGDLRRLRNADDVQISPGGKLVAYTVVNRDRPGRPYSQIWILDVASGNTRRLGNDAESGENPRWSPDGRRLAYIRDLNEKSELVVVGADGSAPEPLAPLQWTNGPLPSTGEV